MNLSKGGFLKGPGLPTKKQWVILFLVFFHFVLGRWITLPVDLHIRQPLRRFPPFQFIEDFYIEYSFSQHWGMFQNPPLIKKELKFSLLTPRGWGQLKDPLGDLSPSYQRPFFIAPRGYIRLQAFFQSPLYKTDLRFKKANQLFFTQLGNYYCGKFRGKGEILGTGFFAETQPVFPFYSKMAPEFKGAVDSIKSIENLFYQPCGQTHENI